MLRQSSRSTPVQLTLEYALAHQPMTRTRDRSTSIAAAASVRVTESQLLALRTLAEHPAGLTDFELADLTKRQQTSIGKRRVDLYHAGLVEEAIDGQEHVLKRPAPSGSPATVWRITQAGLTYLNEHQI